VQTGELAKSKASTDQAKQFGDHMVSDHTKKNDELKQIVSSKQMDLPTGPAAKDQATLKKMQGLSGQLRSRVPRLADRGTQGSHQRIPGGSPIRP